MTTHLVQHSDSKNVSFNQMQFNYQLNAQTHELNQDQLRVYESPTSIIDMNQHQDANHSYNYSSNVNEIDYKTVSVPNSNDYEMVSFFVSSKFRFLN